MFAQLYSFILFIWGHNEYKIVFSIFKHLMVLKDPCFKSCEPPISSQIMIRAGRGVPWVKTDKN